MLEQELGQREFYVIEKLEAHMAQNPTFEDNQRARQR